MMSPCLIALVGLSVQVTPVSNSAGTARPREVVRVSDPGAWTGRAGAGLELSAGPGLNTRYPAPENAEIRAEMIVALMAAHVRLNHNWHLGLRVPILSGGVFRPAGTRRSITMVGHPELSITRLWWLAKRWQFEAMVAIAFPITADSTADPEHQLAESKAMRAAAMQGGLYDSGLFASGRISINHGVAMIRRAKYIQLGFRLQLPLAVRVTRTSSHSDIRVHPVAWTPVLSGFVAWTPARFFALVGRVWGVWEGPPAAVLRSGKPTSGEVVLNPRANFVVGRRGYIGLDVLLPMRLLVRQRGFSTRLMGGLRF